MPKPISLQLLQVINLPTLHCFTKTNNGWFLFCWCMLVGYSVKQSEGGGWGVRSGPGQENLDHRLPSSAARLIVKQPTIIVGEVNNIKQPMLCKSLFADIGNAEKISFSGRNEKDIYLMGGHNCTHWFGEQIPHILPIICLYISSCLYK